MHSVRRELLFCILLVLTGCGYKFGTGGIVQPFTSFSVPYVEGDWDGSLTAEIINEFSRTSRLIYKNVGGELVIKIKILDYYDTNVGFRYDLKKSGEPRNALIPDETRVTLLIELQVVESATGVCLLGPVQLSAETEFDHDYYSTRNQINVFSLGQLTDIDEAYDAAQRPLNRRLAEKIVDYVTANW